MAFGFYDEGSFILPHPPVPLSVLLIVEEALKVAWDLLRQHPRAGFNLITSHEDPLTHELYEILYDKVFNRGLVNGFDSQVFAPSTRESKVKNYDGTKLDNMPDLLIGLIGRPSGVRVTQDWLFIECKPVDVAHPVGQHYCDRGLIRFVDGTYAWAMTEALMIGYVQGSYTILPKLHNALSTRQRTIPTLVFPKPCHHSQAGAYSEQTHISQHERTFNYPEDTKDAPPITIRHLWLKRD